ncbi:16S rRNA (cytosine(1402)-N(4))-methyltransferase RsmH [Candidatus Pelagibacter communis]|uniref:16S rRNA (cytosine(1402)-N(4))-methyltransferase RsmH n=1 Tax=Pelagibacter ubique TaxID=198252 RepID=UPI00094CD9C8|nr:16S rRNA (cytosine(1402)-N(4))-methyltransferase RsmH [Candidatus Pelagibacter ubique]
MEATIVQDNVKHYPVLLKEIISVISPQHGGTFIDCTLGQGGYTKEILKYQNTKVIGIDRDINSEIIGKIIQEKFPDRFLFKNLKFSMLNNLKLKNENIKGIVFDLGYSFTQIKDPKKGLSFNSQGELNMMMGLNDFSAKEAINNLEVKEIEKILKYFGDENDAKIIAKNIVKERQLKIIDTQELVRIIEKSKRKKNYRVHSSTKTFQALRIFVNKEISELINGLINSAKILKKDGILAVVTFHSLEDKIVKYFFKSLSENKSISRYEPKVQQKKISFKMPLKKPIVPSDKELKENLPSRSAKLRYLIKQADEYEIESDILNKFSELIEIENLGLKL